MVLTTEVGSAASKADEEASRASGPAAKAGEAAGTPVLGRVSCVAGQRVLKDAIAKALGEGRDCAWAGAIKEACPASGCGRAASGAAWAGVVGSDILFQCGISFAGGGTSMPGLVGVWRKSTT